MALRRSEHVRRAFGQDRARRDGVAKARATQETVAQGQPNVLRFSCRRGAAHQMPSKKHDLARRRRSAASAGWAAALCIAIISSQEVVVPVDILALLALPGDLLVMAEITL